MSAPVIAITSARTAIVGRVRQTRNPYRMVRLTQMKWNGTVSHSGTRSMAARFARVNSPHATSIDRTPLGPSGRSRRIDAIPHSSIGQDRRGAELGPKPADVHVDHVGPRVEVVAPHRRQQAFLRHGA